MISSVHQALDNRIFHREASSLRRAGYAVTLMAVHPCEEEIDGIRILPVPRLPRWRRPGLWSSLLRRALATGADAYHLHDPELLLILSRLRSQSGRPVVYDAHESLADFTAIKEDIPAVIRLPLAAAIRRAEPWLARRADGLIFADEAIAADFSMASRARTVLFNYPLRSFVDEGARNIRTAEERGHTILYLGGIKRHRGALLMLDAFARVRQAMPSARLLLVGPFLPSTLAAEFQAEVGRRGLDAAVTMTGAIPFAGVAAQLAQADVGWIPFPDHAKYRKNIPTKIFEYYAHGLPVVGSDLPPIRAFLRDGETGCLVAPGDPAAHAGALLALLADPRRATRMGQAGQAEVVKRWNWDAMEARLREFYRLLLGKSVCA
jgi:glycosyltransferase involved in cell wall biosynthesis